MSYTSITSSTTTNYSPATIQNLSFTIPANKTILLIASTTSLYYDNNEFQPHANRLNRIHNIFANANIQCDLRMVKAIQNANMGQLGYYSTNPAVLYNICATLYGDR